MSSKIKDLEGHVRSSKLYVNRQKENGGGMEERKRGGGTKGGGGGDWAIVGKITIYFF